MTTHPDYVITAQSFCSIRFAAKNKKKNYIKKVFLVMGIIV